MGEDEDMKSDKIIKITVVSSITFLLLSILALTYAYFSLEIEGNPKDIVMSTGDLRLEYKDETELKLDGALPGDSISKVITVKNVGTKNVAYSLYWGDLINTIENYELHATLDCKSYTNYGEDTQTESGTCDSIYRAVPISDTITTGNIKGNISIDPNITHEYTVTVTFDNKNYEQNYNKKKSFTGKIGIQEYTAPEVVNCTFDGTLTSGTKYVNGQYTYTYNRFQDSANSWFNLTSNVWSVQLTNKSSTEPVTSSVCTYINDKPVVYASFMFQNSKASSIDLSNFNTSNIINMRGMFYNASTTSINLEKMDTSNVVSMDYMFFGSQATSLDLSEINTSKVSNMRGMFFGSQATSLDLSNFNTSNVSDMYYMFNESTATCIDLSSFNTSKVTGMAYMFNSSKVSIIDLSSFNTSKVTRMGYMFSNAQAKILNLSNFDTSNVTHMASMFSNCKATTISGLNKFNTSKVTDMSYMFFGSQATSIDLSSFDTSNVTNMSYMFSNTQAMSLDLSNFNTSKVTDMNNMFTSAKVSMLNLSNFDTSNVTNMGWMFASLKNIKTLDISKLNTSNVTNMRSMFDGLNISALNVSNFNTSKVTNMSYMFCNSSATSIIGLNNFNTSNVTDMSYMFQSVKASELDVSSFNTSKVTNTGLMFALMYNLLTIYSSDKFVIDNITDSYNMFYASNKLVGSAGTKYNGSYVDKTYARIDGGTDSPGYFTLKTN